MTEHTPGPWKLFIDDSGDQSSGWPISVDATNEPDKTIVRTGGFYPYEWGTATSQDEAVANARLIAAAPDLLEALELLLPVAQAFEKQASMGAGGRRGGPVFTKARAAIAKAKGEPA